MVKCVIMKNPWKLLKYEGNRLICPNVLFLVHF